jgi:outer membrane receptor protein involved in Fe transport
MKLGVKKLSTAVRLALALGAVIAAGASSTVFAQDTGTQGASNQPAQKQPDQKQPDQKKATMLQTVVVTGTRLPSIGIVASSPITTIDAKQFKVTGTTSVDQLVNSMPQLSPYFDQFQNNGATGYPTADLRGLGTSRTLVLIDGQRVQAGAAFAVDLSQIPAALVKRVDILTGGASAVYGADAVAGVVNFVLNDDFEGVQFDYNLSGYQHDNRNKYMQGLETAKGFNAPNGSTGFDGKTRSADAIFGGHFAEGMGHAMGWVTVQKTDGVLQGTRDYSACALNNAGTACGGSGTAPNPNFYVFDQNYNGDISHFDTTTNKWVAGQGQSYNYAPLNYYQRPDTRVNVGTSIKYHVSDAFEPYMDFMYTHRRSAIQVAQSGTFFNQTLSIDCAANAALVGSLCTDLAPVYGLDTSQPLIVYVGKRNVEGGPRITADTTDSYRAVFGAKGDINLNWSYNVAGVLGETSDMVVGTGDMLSDRIAPALMGCPTGSYAGCIPYNVWVPNGVTAAAAANLQGTSLNQTRTRLMDVNAYVSGDLGASLPSADGNPITLVAGTEWRKENFNFTADSNSQAGNFAGSGGPSLPLGGQVSVRELYTEAGIPLIENAGILKSLGLDLGYRYSKYKLSGGTNTFKVGFSSNVNDMFRIRGGFNRAVRAPNISELYSTNQIALYSGSDPCAGATPADTAAQCLNTGVTAAQYGNVPDSPAGQYNQFVGGNQNLKPEKADTYTFGVAVTPMQGLEASVDIYDIKIQNTISTIGASTIVDFCAKTGDPFLCNKVQRNPATGDLWLGQTGKVVNLIDNFGNLETRGIDLNLSYNWSMFGGHAYATLVGTDLLNYKVDPLPGVNSQAQYDCAGKINSSCGNPKWRHIVNLGYSRDWWSVNVRWRHFGALNYVNTDGSLATTDHLVANHDHKISAYNWLDLSGTFKLGSRLNLTVGVNNITDRQPPLVGNSLTFNANTPGGYDELGRYFFTNISMKF